MDKHFIFLFTVSNILKYNIILRKNLNGAKTICKKYKSKVK